MQTSIERTIENLFTVKTKTKYTILELEEKMMHYHQTS